MSENQGSALRQDFPIFIECKNKGPITYYPFQNHYTHEIIIFKLFRGIQLQRSGVCRNNLHYSYSFLDLFCRMEFPSGISRSYFNYIYMT